MDVKEVLLPGVSLRYEFTDHKGDRIGIIARRSGDFDVLSCQPMWRATTSQRVPPLADTCSTRQAMAWIRFPRL